MKGFDQLFRKGFGEGFPNYPSTFSLQPSPFIFGCPLPNPKTLSKHRARTATFRIRERAA